MSANIGWDIGGAHVKAVRAEGGALSDVALIACDSHLGLAQIEQAIRAGLTRLGPAPRHRVTMTAELSDAFENRARGVISIAAMIAREIGAADIRFYAGPQGLIARDAVTAHVNAVASANWRVSAELVAQQCADALFIDFGSTTCDLIPIRAHQIIARGEDDAARLANGELVYAGFSRGAPQAYARRAPVDGQWTPLVNETFATMADIRRMLGDLPEGETQTDLAPTADGRPKTVAASHARLARLAGRDADDWTDVQTRAFAGHLARAQWRMVEDAIALLASRDAIASDAPVIGAGVGRALVRRWALAEGRAYYDFADLIGAPEALKERAADCAPAAALALLHRQEEAP
ncbi:MAG: H4MPT-linked C1 transfer pathway protein [Methylocystis sp.]|nr:H4MPT-linked C1 transfer pathway protein [Methylocystis sp.]